MFSHRPPASFFEYLSPPLFNDASVGAFHVSPDGDAGGVRQLFLNPLQPLRDLFWRLVIHQVTFDKFSQIRMECNFLADLSFCPHADVMHMLRVFGVIRFPFAFFLYLIPDDAFLAVEGLADILIRISFPPQYFDLTLIRIRKSRPLYSFFIRLFYASPF